MLSCIRHPHTHRHFLKFRSACYVLAMLCVLQVLLTVRPQYDIELHSLASAFQYPSVKLTDLVEAGIWICITVLCAVSMKRQCSVLGPTSFRNIFFDIRRLDAVSWLFIISDILFSGLLVAAYIQRRIYMEWTSGINSLVLTLKMYPALLTIIHTVQQGTFILRAHANPSSLRIIGNDRMNHYLMQLDDDAILNLLLLFYAFVPALKDSDKGLTYQLAISEIWYHLWAFCAFLHLKHRVGE